MAAALVAADYVSVCLYFALVVSIGLGVGMRQGRSLSAYFLASRDMYGPGVLSPWNGKLITPYPQVVAADWGFPVRLEYRCRALGRTGGVRGCHGPFGKAIGAGTGRRWRERRAETRAGRSGPGS
jgi:hypothetical protein